MVLFGLGAAAHLLRAPLPERIASRIEADGTVQCFLRQVRERLEDEAKLPSGFFRSHGSQLRLRHRLRDRIVYLYHIAVPPRLSDWEWVRLPDALYPLYYLIRPVRIAVKYSGKARLALGGRLG